MSGPEGQKRIAAVEEILSRKPNLESISSDSQNRHITCSVVPNYDPTIESVETE